jgi:hypothetical protein
MLNELSRSIHENAVRHGWWDEKRDLLQVVALCHTELSEAVEEYRDGKPMEYTVCDDCISNPESGWNCALLDTCPHADHRDKPEGQAVEMIDCVIRILDWCGKEGIDVDGVMRRKMAYNETRPYKHGKIC